MKTFTNFGKKEFHYTIFVNICQFFRGPKTSSQKSYKSLNSLRFNLRKCLPMSLSKSSCEEQ